MTTEERKKRNAECSRRRYHSNTEARERKKLKMKEWALNNAKQLKLYYKKRDALPFRKKQKAAAQDRYRKKMRELGLYKQHRGNRTTQSRRWRNKVENKLKKSAHMKVYFAIKKGVLKKGACEVCGEYPATAHHDDYSKPLEVRWLCNKHHSEHHRGVLK
jgi:hypothetical protein